MDEQDEVVMEAFDNARNTLEDRINDKGFPSKKQHHLIFPLDVHLRGKARNARTQTGFT